MDTDKIARLGHDEREVVRLMGEKQGMTTQSEMAKLPGMTRLEARGIIHVEKYGKINMLRLVDELREAG